MQNAMMGNLDGDLEKIAFDVNRIRGIFNRSDVNAVNSTAGDLFLEIDGAVYPVYGKNGGEVKPFFVVLDSSEAFNVSEYSLLFDVKALPNELLVGKDLSGRSHLCRVHGNSSGSRSDPPEPAPVSVLERATTPETAPAPRQESPKDGRGFFFEELAFEFSGKLKEMAQELIDFRQDLKQKIEPDILEIASRDIPEASNQLEGINRTLESSTMKIMDINEEQMELANKNYERLRLILRDGEGAEPAQAPDEWCGIVEKMKGLVSSLPEEAQQVMQFVIPQLDAGAGLAAGNADTSEVGEAFSDPLMTIEELCGDVGEDSEGIQNLGALCGELRAKVEGQGKPSESPPESGEGDPGPEELRAALREQMEVLRTIGAGSLSMLEPLSFQDLVGQRIQRIIKLVKSMEMRIEDLIISFGIKVKKHKENPAMSCLELEEDVEQFKSELKGPQDDGAGLKQEDIDALLAGL